MKRGWEPDGDPDLDELFEHARQEREEERRRDRHANIWGVLALLALCAVMVLTAVPAFQCVADGGTWVSGVPWPKCIP